MPTPFQFYRSCKTNPIQIHNIFIPVFYCWYLIFFDHSFFLRSEVAYRYYVNNFTLSVCKTISTEFWTEFWVSIYHAIILVPLETIIFLSHFFIANFFFNCNFCMKWSWVQFQFIIVSLEMTSRHIQWSLYNMLYDWRKDSHHQKIK